MLQHVTAYCNMLQHNTVCALYTVHGCPVQVP